MMKNITDGNKIDELIFEKLSHGLKMSDLDYAVLIAHYERSQNPKQIWSTFFLS